MTDEEIIDLFFSRSESAISETQKRYGRLIRSVALGILRNNESAEECENDTYLRAWNNIPPTRPHDLCAYLCRISRSAAFDRYARDHALKRGSACPLEELENVLSASGGAEDRLAERELTELLNGFLGSLDKKSRVVFLRRYWFWDDTAEIAQRLGATESAVKTRLSRTMKKLRDFLGRNGYANGGKTG